MKMEEFVRMGKRAVGALLRRFPPTKKAALGAHLYKPDARGSASEDTTSATKTGHLTTYYARDKALFIEYDKERGMEIVAGNVRLVYSDGTFLKTYPSMGRAQQ